MFEPQDFRNLDVTWHTSKNAINAGYEKKKINCKMFHTVTDNRL